MNRGIKVNTNERLLFGKFSRPDTRKSFSMHMRKVEQAPTIRVLSGLFFSFKPLEKDVNYKSENIVSFKIDCHVVEGFFKMTNIEGANRKEIGQISNDICTCFMTAQNGIARLAKSSNSQSVFPDYNVNRLLGADMSLSLALAYQGLQAGHFTLNGGCAGHETQMTGMMLLEANYKQFKKMFALIEKKTDLILEKGILPSEIDLFRALTWNGLAVASAMLCNCQIRGTAARLGALKEKFNSNTETLISDLAGNFTLLHMASDRIMSVFPLLKD